jgi:hypothetical protein
MPHAFPHVAPHFSAAAFVFAVASEAAAFPGAWDIRWFNFLSK